MQCASVHVNHWPAAGVSKCGIRCLQAAGLMTTSRDSSVFVSLEPTTSTGSLYKRGTKCLQRQTTLDTPVIHDSNMYTCNWGISLQYSNNSDWIFVSHRDTSNDRYESQYQSINRWSSGWQSLIPITLTTSLTTTTAVIHAIVLSFLLHLELCNDRFRAASDFHLLKGFFFSLSFPLQSVLQCHAADQLKIKSGQQHHSRTKTTAWCDWNHRHTALRRGTAANK